MGEITKITSEKTEARRNNKIALVQKKERVKNKAVPAVDNILHLQRTIGNQAVQGLFKSGVLQAKLKIGKPGDKYEQEADRVAEQAMRMPEMTDCLECKENGEEPVQTKAITTRITPLVRRQVDTEEEEEEPIQGKLESLVLQKQAEEEEEEEIQTKSIVEEISPLVQKQDEEEEEEEPIQSKLDSSILQKQVEPEEEEEPIQPKGNSSSAVVSAPGIESSINSLKGGGQPLSESVRNYFEPRFGYDFSGVKVHNDSEASETAKSINAKAFTTGTNIVFNAGQYSPETDAGKRLLAHELTHVVQQNGSPATNINSSRGNDTGNVILRNILGQKKLLQKDKNLDIGLKTEGKQDTDPDMGFAKQTEENTEGIQTKSIIRVTSPSIQRYDEEEPEDDELEEEEEEEEPIQTKPISEQITSLVQRQPQVTLSIDSETADKGKKKAYPPVNWSVNRAKNRKQVLPKAGVTLDEIANFLYGDASAKAELAAENNISPTEPIVPGQPLLLPVKKLTQAANNDFNKSPMVPVWVGNAEAYVAKKKALDRKLQNDFNFIVEKLDETHYSDSDEGEVIAILEKWGEEKFVTRPELYPNGGEYLDKLFSKLKMKTKDVGIITTQWTNYYSMIFNHFDRVDEVVAIRERYSREYKGDRGREELSFGKDVVVKSVVALPGGISAGVGGALKVLPFEFTETIGDALTEQGKEYLKAVGYGDEKMIETAIEWSEFSGAFSAEVVMTATGGNIAKVKKIIDIIEKGEQLLALKKQVESIIKLKDEIPQFLLLFKDREKLFAVVLGLEDEQIINRLEEWALEFSSDVDVKKKSKSKKKKGFKAILARIKNIVDKVRQIFYPIFSVRRRIIDFIDQFAAILSKIPLFNELLEMLLDKEKRPKDLKGFFNQLTDIVAQKFLDKLDEVRNLLMNFIGKGEEFLNSIAINAKEIANVITDFSLNIIEKQIKMVKAIRAFPEIKDLIADRLVKPLLPEEPLKAVNKEIRKVTSQIIPVIQFIKNSIGYIYSKARNAFKEQLVPAFKNLFIQTSRNEGDENFAIFDTKKLQSHIMRSSGEEISDSLKEEMESKFGQDFKGVQIHRDMPAQKANEMLQSNAFTTGKNIYFGEGKFSPDTKTGQRLIAHELSHVVQQKQGRQVNVIQPDSKTLIKKIVAKSRKNILKNIKSKTKSSGKKKVPRKSDAEIGTVRKEIKEKLESGWFRPGKYAKEYVDKDVNPKAVFKEWQRKEIDRIGYKYGDHHTREKDPGQKRFTPDHQPVTGLVKKAEKYPELKKIMKKVGLATTLANQRLYPHTYSSFKSQGGTVTAIHHKLKKMEKLKGKKT
jgi:hypothetical protein